MFSALTINNGTSRRQHKGGDKVNSDIHSSESKFDIEITCEPHDDND